MGAANLGSGLLGGMVVNGSLSKTAVNGGAGAKSQLSGLAVAALTVVTLLFLTGLFEDLPEATLAAVVIAAVDRAGRHRLAAPAVRRVDRPARRGSTTRGPRRLHRRRSPPCSACWSSTPCRACSSASRSRCCCCSTGPRVRTWHASCAARPDGGVGRPRPVPGRRARHRCRGAAGGVRTVLRQRRPRARHACWAPHRRHHRRRPGRRDLPSIDVTGAGMLSRSEPGCPSAASSCSSRSPSVRCATSSPPPNRQPTSRAATTPSTPPWPPHAPSGPPGRTAHQPSAHRQGRPMNDVIGEILPLALGVAISPIPIIAAILMLLSPEGEGHQSGLPARLGARHRGRCRRLHPARIRPPRRRRRRLQAGRRHDQDRPRRAPAALATKQWRAARAGSEPALPHWMGAIDTMTAAGPWAGLPAVRPEPEEPAMGAGGRHRRSGPPT